VEGKLQFADRELKMFNRGDVGARNFNSPAPVNFPPKRGISNPNLCILGIKCSYKSKNFQTRYNFGRAFIRMQLKLYVRTINHNVSLYQPENGIIVIRCHILKSSPIFAICPDRLEKNCHAVINSTFTHSLCVTNRGY